MEKNISEKILIVDDDLRICQLLSAFLRQNGFLVQEANNTRDAMEKIFGTSFDLIIMDVMMPEQNGIEFTNHLRQQISTPILMLSALSETKDRVDGLRVGADDYLPKPFDPEELLLRIRAILRREKTPSIIKFNNFELNVNNRELSCLDADKSIIHKTKLTFREFLLLRKLLKHKNQTVPRSSLANINDSVFERTVDVQITRLRKKLKNYADPNKPEVLKTVRGIGYCLVIE